MVCGFFSLLLRSKSGASWSASLVHPLTQCAWPPVSHGGFWKNFLFYVPIVALFALGNLDFAFALVSFSPSVFGCCLRSTSYFRDACFAWFNSGYLFHGRHLANFTYFLRAVHSDPWRSLSIPQNGEVCTVDASSCSVSSRGSHFESGHYLYELSICGDAGFLTHFASFFALLRLSRS